MMAGPVVSRELLTVARRSATFRRRCLIVSVLFLALGLLFGLAEYGRGRALTIRELAVFSLYVFGFAAHCQVSLTLGLVPVCAAPTIAVERERRTLTGLLTTRLSSAEIVLGKLAAALVNCTACLAAGVPMMLLLPLLGGVDPRLVVLAYAGTASTTFFLAALSIVVSTGARRGARAVAATIGLAALWCTLPVFVQFFVPRTMAWLWPWVYPVNAWIVASSPAGPLLVGLGAGPGWRFFESVAWMIALQVGAGSALVAWAVARFRRASRAIEEGDEPARSGRPFPRLLGRRPPYEDNPVLWKELHTARSRGLGLVVGTMIGVGLTALIGYGTWRFAQPAFAEWLTQGSGQSVSDVRRTEFNEFLRIITSWIEFFTLLIAAGVAAEGIAAERARDTWDGLIATPLNGRTILGAKMIGAAWKVRWWLMLLGLLWSVGLIAGSLHPVGFVAALLLLGVATWCMVALGTFMSLISRDTAQASNRTLIPVLLLSGSFLVCYLPMLNIPTLLGIGSAPFVNWLALISYRDMDAILSRHAPYGSVAGIAAATAEGPLRVVATCLLGTIAHAAAAAVLCRAAFARFDRHLRVRQRPHTLEGPTGSAL
jgi:ABC-type transport system involved in multi-copper enzyme maturation permease subunit